MFSNHTLVATGLNLIICFGSGKLDAATPEAPTQARVMDSFEQVGIDTRKPRFGWVDNSSVTDRGETQTAYEIMVAASEADLLASRGTVWDSGKVDSPQQYGVDYAGADLNKTSKYWWKVRSWDNTGQPSPWSKNVSFITGFFKPEDWDATGQWIEAPESVTVKSGSRPLFRKAFQINKPVRDAYLYITGLGQFVAFLNGSKVGNHEIDPAWTDYDHSVDYVTFDVASQLKMGANVLGVMLGSGWLDTHDNLTLRNFGGLRMRAQLHLEYADGTSEELVSDTSWKTAKGPFTMTELHGAEDYDARMDQAGWNRADFDDTTWSNASTAASPGGVLVAQSCPPVIVRQTYTVANITNPAPHHYVYDMGQNFNGVYSITVTGDTGNKIRILAGESLNKDGTVNPGRSAGSNYTLKGGNNPESWRLSFSTLGFRYIELSDVTKDEGIPCPRILSFWPLLVPGEMRTFTLPWSVGTSTVVPKTPSHGARSRS
jgi:alpha-L-rhamnosidase